MKRKTLLFLFLVKPTKTNPRYKSIKDGLGYVWIIHQDVNEARALARIHLEQDNWEITGMEIDGLESTLEHYRERPEGRLCFLAAQRDGISSFVVATGVADVDGVDFEAN